MLNRLFKNLFRENRVVWDEKNEKSRGMVSSDDIANGSLRVGADGEPIDGEEVVSKSPTGGVVSQDVAGELLNPSSSESEEKNVPSEELLSHSEVKRELSIFLANSVYGMDVSSIDSYKALENAVKAKAEAAIDGADKNFTDLADAVLGEGYKKSAVDSFSDEVVSLAEEGKLVDAISGKTKDGKKTILKVGCDDAGKLTVGVEEGVEKPAEAPAPEPAKEELTEPQKNEILAKKKEIYAELVKAFTAPIKIENPGAGAREEMKQKIKDKASTAIAVKESKIWELDPVKGLAKFVEIKGNKDNPLTQFIAETFAEDAVKGVPDSIWLEKTDGMVNQLTIAYVDKEPYLQITKDQVVLNVEMTDEQKQDYDQIKSKGLGFFGFILKLFGFVPDRAKYADGPAGEAAYRQAYDAALKAGVDGTDSFLNFALGLAGYKCGQQSIDQLKAMAPGHEAEIDQFVGKMQKYLGKLNVAGAEKAKMVKAGDFGNELGGNVYSGGLKTACSLDGEYTAPEGQDLKITLKDENASVVFKAGAEVYRVSGDKEEKVTISADDEKIAGTKDGSVLIVRSGHKLASGTVFSEGAVLEYKKVEVPVEAK